MNELKLMGYSLDIFSAPQSATLIQRLCGQVDAADPSPSPEYSDSELLDMFLSVDPAWLATPGAMPDNGIPDDAIFIA